MAKCKQAVSGMEQQPSTVYPLQHCFYNSSSPQLSLSASRRVCLILFKIHKSLVPPFLTSLAPTTVAVCRCQQQPVSWGALAPALSTEVAGLREKQRMWTLSRWEPVCQHPTCEVHSGEPGQH